MLVMAQAALEDPGFAQAARYESLIRLAEAIRAGAGVDNLFALLVEQMRGVVPFDAMAQFDETSTKVKWHYERPSGSTGPCPLQAAHSPDTVAGWVHARQ